MDNGFRERAESYATRFQVIQQANQIPQRATQPVELPYNKCIIIGEHLETLCQFRTLDMRSRGLIGEDALAPRLLEGGKLQVGVLVFGRNLRIADFHEPVLSLIYGTTKPLIEQGHEGVSKILRYCWRITAVLTVGNQRRF